MIERSLFSTVHVFAENCRRRYIYCKHFCFLFYLCLVFCHFYVLLTHTVFYKASVFLFFEESVENEPFLSTHADLRELLKVIVFHIDTLFQYDEQWLIILSHN